MVKIFVGNLSQETTAEELRSLFSQYGKISECDIVKNYGFVHMDDKAEAEQAIRNLHHYELNGQPMNVEMSRGKTKASTKLHVSNIGSGCTNQELRAKFEEYGPVVECDIVKDYAFVHMERVEDAMEAISGLDNTAFQGKLLSVKLSTSRLRTAPGMGARTGCYRCGQEGHWSKECPQDQNGSYREGPTGPGANGFGPPRFAEGAGGRGFHGGFSGDPAFGGSYGPTHGFGRGGGYGGGAAYESAMSYGPMPGYGYGYGNGSEFGMARAYASEASYGGGGASYGAVPGYPAQHSAYEERDPYGMVDFYEKYRACSYGAGYFDEQRSVPMPPPPPPGSCDRRPLPPPPAPGSSGYTRDRSPIRRVPSEAEGYSHERSQLSSASSLAKSSTYDMSQARDPYGERTRYAF